MDFRLPTGKHYRQTKQELNKHPILYFFAKRPQLMFILLSILALLEAFFYFNVALICERETLLTSALLGNYDRPTDQATNQPTDRQREVTL